MAIAGEHAKIGAEIFVNCLRLSGRFDYDNCHGSEAETLCFCLSSKVYYRRQWSPTLPPARYELTSLSLFVNRADSGIRQIFVTGVSQSWLERATRFPLRYLIRPATSRSRSAALMVAGAQLERRIISSTGVGDGLAKSIITL